MDVLILLGTFVVGVALLLIGGGQLVTGAAGLARRLGIAPVVIGLTVVAFGTSAPELALNIAAAIAGHTDLSYGNIVGSNIANVGLILGMAALFRPLAVHDSLVKREMPIMIVAAIALAALAYLPPRIGGGPGGGGVPGLSWVDGIILLAAFCGFMAVTLRTARTAPDAGKALAHEVEEIERQAPKSLWRAWLAVGVGLALLVVGGKIAEHGATGMARLMGLSETVIGLTIVAVATSLPELATSIIAAKRGEADIAVGNVVGSNIFNILLIMGVTTLVAPVTLPEGAWFSLAVMVGLSVLLLPMSITDNRTVSRVEGAALLAIYFGAMGFEVWRTVRA